MSVLAEHRLPTANLLVEGLEHRTVHPTALVVFGATGDLSRRKLLPAVYNLGHDGALPEQFELVGVSRGETAEDFRAMARQSIERFSRRPPDPEVLARVLAEMRYVPGEFGDADVYRRVAATLEEIDAEAGLALNRIFYLSTAPQYFSLICGRLNDVGLNRSEKAQTRIVIEKPFGYDLASARKLNAQVLEAFEETQVFRIDHYLGKETVQNMMAMRFANTLFEPVWDRNYVDHVQITAAEAIGIEGRAGYYDRSGALRDLIQNHMLQLLALVAMEPATALEPNRVRDEKLKVLDAIVPPKVTDIPSMAVRAQYAPGVVGGRPVPGYRQEEGVASDSRTETYAALCLRVSNWRWAGVPFYLRAGKRLARKLTEIAIQLKPVPHLAFQDTGSTGVQANTIVVTIQPDEGVSVSLQAKIPGTLMRLRSVNMEYRYDIAFPSQSPESYERLILDAMLGDPTLFTRGDEIEALWGIVNPILAAWEADSYSPIPQYPAGSAGPIEANTLVEADGRRWRRV